MTESKKTVLIVEDNTAMQQSIQQAFKRAGFNVLTALDGRWGLDTALREKPAAILLDVMMANMDGVTMLKQLRADTWGRSVPVLILTNLTYLEDMPEVQELATEFLSKVDLDLQEIVDKVVRHIEADPHG